MEATVKYPLMVLCSAFLASAAIADDDKSSRTKSPDLFTTVDADSDGKVSKEEAAVNSNFANNFSMLDGNSDGVVTKREFRRNTMPKPDRD
jgi:Ca2+-binding EF-hand superfamily protein